MGSLLVLLALLSASTAVNVPCYFENFDKGNPPLFVKPHTKVRFLWSGSDYGIQMPHDDKVEAYCNHFKSPQRDEEDNWVTNEMVEIQCNNGSISLSDHRSEYLSCDVASFFAYDLEYCDFLSYLIGLNVHNTPVVLAAVCFDENEQQTKFMKLVPKKRGWLLTQQAKFSPVNIENVDIFESHIQLPYLYSDVLSDEETNSEMERLIGKLANVVKFSESSLVPPHVFKPTLFHNNSVNTIIWWKALRDGNWAYVYSLLHKQTGDFEIYTGSSGVATIKNDYGRTINLTLNIGRKVVPLYVWIYLKAEDGNNIVIVGVNSPFVSNERTSPELQICESNICDRTKWLKGKRNTFNLPAFGFVACCEPSGLRIELDGLPKKLVSQYAPHYVPQDDSNDYESEEVTQRPQFKSHRPRKPYQSHQHRPSYTYSDSRYQF